MDPILDTRIFEIIVTAKHCHYLFVIICSYNEVTNNNDNNMTSSRREKKEKVKPSNVENFHNLESSLAQAQAAIETSQAGIAKLHYEWRSHLQRLGYMMVFISLYQLYRPAKSCFEELTEWNSQRQQLSEAQVALVVLSDSVAFVLALVVAVLLVSFMHSQHRSLSNPKYLLASAFIPAILALWFIQKQQKTYETVPNCLATNLLLNIHATGETQGTASRDLPVVLVFHVLVSACYFFMSHQRAKQARNLEAIVQLREELHSSKKKR